MKLNHTQRELARELLCPGPVNTSLGLRDLSMSIRLPNMRSPVPNLSIF